MQPFALFAAAVLALLALAHLLRLLAGIQVRIGSLAIPPWMSAVAALALGALALLVIKEQRKR